MKVIFNNDMRAVLLRNPIHLTYRATRKLEKVKLHRAGKHLYASANAQPPKAGQLPPGARPQDIDVASTRIELSDIAQEKYASAAFHLLWRIASASHIVGSGICSLVSIMDDTIIRHVAGKWIDFEPSCSLAFFRGDPHSYFADIAEAIGANLILELDSVKWRADGFAAFASELTERVTQVPIKPQISS